MPNPQLKEYVKAQLSQGVSKEAIKSALRDAGWQEPDIAQAFETETKPISFEGLTPEAKPVKQHSSTKTLITIIVVIVILFGATAAGAYFIYGGQITALIGGGETNESITQDTDTISAGATTSLSNNEEETPEFIEPSVNILSPKGGERYTLGQKLTLQWNEQGVEIGSFSMCGVDSNSYDPKQFNKLQCKEGTYHGNIVLRDISKEGTIVTAQWEVGQVADDAFKNISVAEPGDYVLLTEGYFGTDKGVLYVQSEAPFSIDMPTTAEISQSLLNEEDKDELLREARDSQRISDLSAIQSSIVLYLILTSEFDLDGPSNEGTCADEPNRTIYYSLPSNLVVQPPVGWQAKQAPPEMFKNVNGTGWLPIDLTQAVGGSPLTELPIDQKNQKFSSTQATEDLYYTYVCNRNENSFELNANMESEVYSVSNSLRKSERMDLGDDPEVFETGTDAGLDLIPKGTYKVSGGSN